MKTKESQKEVSIESKERRERDFETLLSEEIDYLGEEQSWVILKKLENRSSALRTLKKQTKKSVRDGIHIAELTRPLVFKVANAGTTQAAIAKCERKGWKVVATNFTKDVIESAKKDDRINELLGHVEARKAYSEDTTNTKEAFERKVALEVAKIKKDMQKELIKNTEVNNER